MLEEVAEVLEKDLKIVGATAIEDKLQEGVSATIFNLAQAGIKIWMLTGDKEETAINIGHACRLINDTMRLLIINQEDLNALTAQVDGLYQSSDVQLHIKSKKVSSHLAVVCDGKSLIHVFPPKNATTPDLDAKAKELARKILEISSVCQALIACRVSPAQKADLVSLVRFRSPTKVITLAIGDGANDVNMVRSAHVGVGVSGQEGVQAVNASDYAIAQFCFLERLLLVHGRYNYIRMSKAILYSFYKNVTLVIALFLFNFYNGQSGTSVFESFVMTGWNFFLALPIIAIGVFDEDVPQDQVLQHPRLYIPGQKNNDLSVQRFSIWILNAITQALLCFMLTVYGITNVDGLSVALYLQGTVIYSVLLMSANVKVAFETLSWTKFNAFFLLCSISSYFCYVIILQYLGNLGDDLYGVTFRMLQSPIYWLYMLLVPVTSNVFDMCFKYIQTNYSPTMANVLHEKSVFNLSSAQVTCEPPENGNSLPERTSFASPPPGSVVIPYSGFAFSSPEGIFPDHREDHDLASLKVIQFHREEHLRSGKLQSFNSSSRAGALQSFEKNNVVVSDIVDAATDDEVQEIEHL